MIGKMNKSILVAGTALMAALSAAGLQAEPIQLAALSSVEGKVLVNKGKGFATAKPGTQLVEGDRVIALDGAKAAVVYKDGCVTQLKENSLLALDKAAGCGKEAVKTGGGQPLRYAQAIGATQTDAGGGSGGGAGNPNRDDPNWFVLGAWGLGALCATAVICNHGNSGNRPISGF